MRMRRKRNLDARLEGCIGQLLPVFPEELDSSAFIDGGEYLDYSAIFGNGNPVEMEIGCGKGRFICELAASRPDTNFIAVERSENVLVTACERAMAEGLGNVRFLDMGAEYLDRYIPAGTIDRVYLNFSCPYPKGGYENRRLTNARFLALFARLLRDGEGIVQKTDNRHFFEYSITSLSREGWLINEITLDLHAESCPDNIVTKYEQKFAETGKPIYRLRARPGAESRRA